MCAKDKTIIDMLNKKIRLNNIKKIINDKEKFIRYLYTIEKRLNRLLQTVETNHKLIIDELLEEEWDLG